MKVFKYRLMTEVNHGTEEEPDIVQSFSGVTMPYSEAAMAIAEKEAYNGEYTIEDDGEPEPELPATPDARLEALEQNKADREEVEDVWDQMAQAYAEGVNEA